MPRNGSGGYAVPQNSWNPAINGMGALPNDWMAILNDMVAAIQASIAADGQTPITGSLNFGNNRLRSVGAPQGQGDALRFEQFAKGPDIASAAAIAFPIEGSLFDVTGTTAVTSIAASSPGRTVLTHFTGSLTLTHSANLALPGATDITTQAGDFAAFVCLDGTKWQCWSYPRRSPLMLTFAQINALTSDQGPISCTDQGGAVYAWSVSAYVPLIADETYAGSMKRATTALAQGLANDEVALTPKKLADALKGGNQALAASGYQKLPGGLILQWGSVSVTENSSVGAYFVGTASVVFPISFPNSAWLAFVTPRNTPNALDAATYAGLSVTGMSIIGTTSNESPQTATINYLVIGN